MNNEQAIIIIGNLPIESDGCYSISKYQEAKTLAIEALEQDKSYDFARWVTEEIFDEMWEYNKDAFGELACRKLAKMGIVKANGDKWELVEPQESEEQA